MTWTLRLGTALIVVSACSGDKGASPKKLCEHLASIAPDDKRQDLGDCVEKMKKMKTELGEDYPKFSRCVAKARALTDLVACSVQSKAVGQEDFDTYQKKSKAVEAQVNLRRIYDGVRMAAMDETLDSVTMTVTPPGLPQRSVGPTPPLGTCCSDGGKCEPKEEYWQDPTWKQVMFEMMDPFYYSYEYKKISETQFEVKAHGDLDCDGEYSTFSLVGTMSAEGDVGAPPELVKANELE